MIKIDITGFYYEIEVDPEGVVTVADAMRKATEAVAPNGGKLKVDTDLNGFVNCLTVDYPSDARPASRQSGDTRPVGKYSYDDNPIGGGNVVPGGGNINGQLAWQYYVEREGVTVNRDRVIIPITQSDQSAVGPLQPTDLIIWRLVAIFGLREKMKENQDVLDALVAESPQGNLSMKSAMRHLKSAANTG
ncbi:MAG: hypothetical protein AAGI70_01260 [Pseudomonadota bacterium]